MRRSLIFIAALALTSIAALVGVRASSDDGRPASRPELQRVLDALVTGPGRAAPGAAVYIRGPRGAWLGSAGLADVARRTPMPVDARVRLESVSKIWTAVIILQLAADGTLGLDDTVERWLPGVLPYGRSITIRQLLTHRSGIVDNNDVTHGAAPFIARVRDAEERAAFVRLAHRWNTDPALEFSPTAWIRLAAWQPLLFKPGTDYHYSNIGFELLGLIASRASGEALATLYRTRIFEPLSLANTAYDPQGPIAGPHARGYSIASGGAMTDSTDYHGGVGAEGGIVADAQDTATFLAALLHGQLLDPRSLAAMKNGSFWSGGEETGCGIAYGHGGAGAGFKTNVWASGDGSRIAVLLLNGRRGDYGDAQAGAALVDLYCKG